jgi:short-subunit dehydrogenase
VLIARRGERLEDLARTLGAQHPGLKVEVQVADLTDSEARGRTISWITGAGYRPDLLINNAGMGDYGEFSQAEWPKLESMLRLNVEALTHLSHAVLPLMMAGDGGSIINVSSLACMLPIPDFAVYAATKAYVTSFSEALRLEVRDHGIGVTALCPGPVHTEFGQVAKEAGGGNEFPGREFFYTDKRLVVAKALKAAAADRARVFPGWQVAVAALVIAALPIGLVRLAMGTRPRR